MKMITGLLSRSWTLWYDIAITAARQEKLMRRVMLRMIHEVRMRMWDYWRTTCASSAFTNNAAKKVGLMFLNRTKTAAFRTLRSMTAKARFERTIYSKFLNKMKYGMKLSTLKFWHEWSVKTRGTKKMVTHTKTRFLRMMVDVGFRTWRDKIKDRKLALKQGKRALNFMVKRKTLKALSTWLYKTETRNIQQHTIRNNILRMSKKSIAKVLALWYDKMISKNEHFVKLSTAIMRMHFRDMNVVLMQWCSLASTQRRRMQFVRNSLALKLIVKFTAMWDIWWYWSSKRKIMVMQAKRAFKKIATGKLKKCWRSWKEIRRRSNVQRSKNKAMREKLVNILASKAWAQWSRVRGNRKIEKEAMLKALIETKTIRVYRRVKKWNSWAREERVRRERASHGVRAMQTGLMYMHYDLWVWKNMRRKKLKSDNEGRLRANVAPSN